MPFTDQEIAEYTALIEQQFWSRHRPPLHLRDKVLEGQRIEGYAIELFFVRPAFNRPGQTVEESIAKVRYVASRRVWRLFWKRADLKWHGYEPRRETKSLGAALQVIDEDAYNCFFG